MATKRTQGSRKAEIAAGTYKLNSGSSAPVASAPTVPTSTVTRTNGSSYQIGANEVNIGTKENPNIVTYGQSGTPSGTKTIAVNSDMKPAPVIPTTPTATTNDSVNYNGVLSGINQSATTASNALNQNIVNTESNFANLIKTLNAPVVNQEDIYQKTLEESGKKEAQKLVNDLSGQLNQITSQAQANQLQVVGQGRGIPEAIIGGQQAQIAREAAIQSLPIAAQLSAAQGNLEMATQNLNTLFTIRSADAKAKYDNKVQVAQAVYQFANDKEKSKLDYAMKLEDRAYQEQQDLSKQQQTYANTAFENLQPKLGAQIAALDYKSPTFKADLVKLQAQLRDPVKQAQLTKLNSEIAQLNNSTKTVGGVNQDLTAYASQYSETGKLPSPAELKLSGLSVGQVTAFAKQIPKAKGAVVSNVTGAKPGSVSATAQEDFQKLYNVVEMTKRLKELDKKRVGGIISGTVGAIFGSEDQAEYLTLRKAIVDEMSRMQSGAALTPDEIAVYNDYLPGRFSETLGLGQDSSKKINNFETAMNQKLENRLANNELSIYGYSKVKVGDTLQTVGDIIDIGGVNYRVLPDGTLSDIL